MYETNKNMGFFSHNTEKKTLENKILNVFTLLH